MNNKVRKNIRRLIEQIEGIQSEIEDILFDEEDKFDNMPEAFQDGEAGEKAQEVIGYIEYSIDQLTDCVDNLNEAIS